MLHHSLVAGRRLADRRSRFTLCVSLAAIAVTLAAPISARAETTTYTYDALGRLTNTAIAGGANDGTTTSTNYDAATNRTNYAVFLAPPPPPAVPAIADSSFEQPVVAGFEYNPFATGTTFSTRSGIAANYSAWGFSTAPNGNQVGFLQGYTDMGSTITLQVTGLTIGQYYAFRYQAAQRPGFSVNPVTVNFAGMGLGTYTAPTTGFSPITTQSFTAASTSGTLTFSVPVAPGDYSSAIDNITLIPGGSPPTVSAAPGVIPHYSFELPNEGAGIEYRPNYYGDLYFQNGAGIAGNGSAWGFVNAPVGTQAAFFQDSNASVSTNVSGLTVGATYTVKFKATKRPNWPVNQLYVSFQGNNLGYYTPTSDTSFQQFTTTSFAATASTGVLTIVGLTSGPTGTGVDDIQISSP